MRLSHWALFIGLMLIFLLVSLVLLGPLFYGPDNVAPLSLAIALIFITIPALIFYIWTRINKP